MDIVDTQKNLSCVRFLHFFDFFVSLGFLYSYHRWTVEKNEIPSDSELRELRLRVILHLVVVGLNATLVDNVFDRNYSPNILKFDGENEEFFTYYKNPIAITSMLIKTTGNETYPDCILSYTVMYCFYKQHLQQCVRINHTEIKQPSCSSWRFTSTLTKRNVVVRVKIFRWR